MKDLKNTVTTTCAYIALLGIILGVILGVLRENDVHIPTWLLVVTGCCVAIPPAVIGFFSGRNADGSRKSAAQIDKQNELKNS